MPGNTLTGLIPDFYAAMNVVGRELVGFIPAITISPDIARAAVSQSVRIPIAPAAVGENIVAGTNPPDSGDQTMDYTSLTITKSRAFPFRHYGEEERGLAFGPGRLTIQQQQIAQAIRAAVNEIEADIGLVYTSASRALGTAGTAPFASTLNVLNDARKILVDNGCPDNDLHFVMDTTAGVNMRNLTQLQKVNESGDSSLLRQGLLGNLSNFDIRESAQVALHTAGTANANYDTNLGAPLAVGDRTVAVDTGSGTIVAGDCVSFAGSSHVYVVNTALSGGSFVLNKPGLRATLADGVDVTVGAAYRANMVFHRNAIVAAIRAPALPREGDMADDRTVVVDPYTGLVFELALYKQYRRVRYELAVAWGVGAIKPEHMALIRG